MQKLYSTHTKILNKVNMQKLPRDCQVVPIRKTTKRKTLLQRFETVFDTYSADDIYESCDRKARGVYVIWEANSSLAATTCRYASLILRDNKDSQQFNARYE